MNKEVVDFFNRINLLVEEGKLPDSSSVFPRVVYQGHEVIHTYDTVPEDILWRCVSCMKEWSGASKTCPGCNQEDNSFQLNISREARWKCRSCSNEWDGEIGWRCPSCKAEHGAPSWMCRNCSHKWSGESNICPYCSADYYDSM